MKRRVAAGVIFAVALVTLAERYTSLQVGLMFPLLLGLGFLGWSLLAREWGLLVPGGVLIGIGGGLVMQRAISWGAAWDQALFFFCFAGGWALIWLLSRAFFRRNVWWPLIPGGVMVVLGFGQLWQGEMRSLWQTLAAWWPFLLIAVAAWLWFGCRREK